MTRMAMIENNTEYQKRGMVLVIYNVGDAFSFAKMCPWHDVKSAKTHVDMTSSLPLKHIAVHHCISDYKMRMIEGLFVAFATKEIRLRYKRHIGSHPECLLKLSMYGLNTREIEAILSDL
ncbi:MAG: hypothetical protein AAF614_21090 [Chloroflexota bacterium]